MLKWRLMLTTVPYVLAAVAVKMGLHHGLGFDGVIEFSDISLVLTGGVFLIGFMLSGTMADYKESEKLPGELACTLETIEETFVQACLTRPALDRRQGMKATLEAARAIDGWLHRRVAQTEVYSALERMLDAVGELERANATTWANRATSELNTLRKLVTRIGVVSRTNFLAPGYALLDTLTTLVIGLLLVARFKYPLAEGLLVGFVTLIFVYMVRLIRDIDDPFEYSADGELGATEVELFPLTEYTARLEAKMAALPPVDADRAAA